MTGAPATESRPGPVARAGLWLIEAYQAARRGRPSPCRFTPTCSAYAHEAIEVHGAGRGSFLAVRRLCRCHPWGGHGWDPVPPAHDGPDAAPSSHPRKVA